MKESQLKSMQKSWVIQKARGEEEEEVAAV